MIIAVVLIVTIFSILVCIGIKKTIIRGIFGFLAVISVMIVVLAGSFTYVTRYKVHEVADSTSPDGKYELLFQQVGDPDWPFGRTHARLVLKDESGTISKYSFDVANDGGIVQSDSWQVTWLNDRVEAVISGEEQNDDQYVLYFNGKKDFHQLKTQYGTYSEEKRTEEIKEIEKESRRDEVQQEPYVKEPEYIDLDYTKYFENVKGCAVIYDADADIYYLCNSARINYRESPYSTFKIVSTLIGLKNGVIQDENSVMEYNGTDYGFVKWNTNLTLKEAFENSCIWYFRKIIDTVGEEEVTREIRSLGYGNCNTSEWNGSGINPIEDLNGFWLASSLEITPMEQVEVLKKIFQGQSEYSETDIATLKNIMLVDSVGEYTIYGKTGTNPKSEGWYIGLAEGTEKEYYFSCYVSSDEPEYEASGQIARNIVKEIFEDNIGEEEEKVSLR